VSGFGRITQRSGLKAQVHSGDKAYLAGTTQGSRFLRSAQIEAASRHQGAQAERSEAIAARRDSRKIARVALARHTLRRPLSAIGTGGR
jgi:signal transduction histidine kinase